MYNKKDMTAPGISYQDLKLMQGYPPSREKQVGQHNWDSPPYNRWSFQHMSQLFPVAAIHRGPGPVTEFERNERSLDAVLFQRVDGGQTDLATFLNDSYTDGFLVLHQGKVVTEQYFNGMQPHTLHLLQSVSKTIIGSLVGRLIGQGRIDPQARVSNYVPELSESGYGDARVQDLLDMRTGVRFREDYTDPDAEFIQLDVASGWRERGELKCPDSIYGLLKSLSKDREHGKFFEYRSVDTDMLAWVCERACGERLPVLLSREIWSKLGAEQDANITLDCVGTALADGGVSATLRDLARFAQMYLQGGYFNGQQIVPQEFVRACGSGSTPAFEVLYDFYVKHFPNSAYSNQCWVLDSEQGTYSARGVFGQSIYWHPASEVVIVKLSSWPDFINSEWTLNTFRACEAVVEELQRS
ncbi:MULTISPECIES: serine hydrolase domain-containing protein [Pseudomonas]|uniref:serine hydrolase domain-containing protein n=1 Tax=Pseudomonas TaxID=286 RepID=UPI00161CC746|nr:MULTISPECIES: serine hydrolase [Pseudomonas]MBB3274138.1 CubicO group peptidase (beta-lactamase class C family) [Pseudomonas sp. OG7]MBH3397587.1 serine hydrolase [Pseudomonas monteilii]